MEYANSDELVGGDKNENAKITRDILAGTLGAKRNAVLLNAGMSIYLAKDGLSIQDGINIAKDTIDTGKAKYQMERFIKYSNEVC